MASRLESAPGIVLTGGGTGGHVYPALAVAAAVRERRPEARLLFVGGDRVEARLVPEAGIPFRAISVHGLAGRGMSAWMRRLRSLSELTLCLPLLQSIAALRRFGAAAVIGTGGYVSGPVLLAARLLRIPSVALEGNRTPGLTSRIVARMVHVMAVAHPETARFFAQRLGSRARVVITGLPVRSRIMALEREAGAAALGLDPGLTTLVVLGGSLGSRRLNEALVGALRALSGREAWVGSVQVLHVTGERYAESIGAERDVLPHYRAVPYLEAEYPESLAAADLVVSRAGASTIAELTARGVAAVLAPWSGASTGEQVRNAEVLEQTGAAVVIPDPELTAERLRDVLGDLLRNKERRAQMARASRSLGKRRAAADVAAIALALAEG